MRSLSTLPATWQHGLLIGLIAALTLAASFLLVFIAVVLINGALGLVGAGFAEDRTVEVVLWLSPLWVPLSLGSAAPYFAGLRPHQNGPFRAS